MPDYCSCGAQLPPDARFCHKCGKPQFEMPVVEVEETPPPPSPAMVREAAVATGFAEVSFRNRAAVRIGLLAATLASLLTSLPLPMMLNFVWFLVCLTSAGFLAVYLYNRRTGEDLDLRSGAKLGWITGIFCFVIATIFFTITMIMVSMKGGLASFYREQVAAQNPAGVDMKKFLALLENPMALASIILMSLLLMFVFFTLLPTLGGLMGAKVLEKE